ncbi:hypothetical protein BJP37_31405 [Moorena bouillonii PNG]|uniref:Uncharacterized protein n=1 Tax=Moorena bouillonii PNG TaxID=568701 RepID=A0A1U7NAB3_9CYAN|nr:hypothetical protein BJP37_31405 [Moorena bouillonii PNG]
MAFFYSQQNSKNSVFVKFLSNQCLQLCSTKFCHVDGNLCELSTIFYSLVEPSISKKAEMTTNRIGQSIYKKFSIKN